MVEFLRLRGKKEMIMSAPRCITSKLRSGRGQGVFGAHMSEVLYKYKACAWWDRPQRILLPGSLPRWPAASRCLRGALGLSS